MANFFTRTPIAAALRASTSTGRFERALLGRTFLLTALASLAFCALRALTSFGRFERALVGRTALFLADTFLTGAFLATASWRPRLKGVEGALPLVSFPM